MVKRLYPRACENRTEFSHSLLRANRPRVIKATAFSFVILQLLFFALFCYLFGALYQQVPRTHDLRVVWVDYDGGIIGQAVRNAYRALESSSFPTFIEKTPAEYPTQDSLREEVCKTDYWAAFYTAPKSSANLGLAIAGLNTSQYNQSDVLYYIWNQARYPTVMDGTIGVGMQLLSSVARTVYSGINGTAALPTIPHDNPAALSTFMNPWILNSINIKPTTQGARVIYNTIVIVLVLVQDFFFLATINGLSKEFKIYNRVQPRFIFLIRQVLAVLYTLIGSLLTTASIWAFKSGWDVSGSQFVLTWLALWLFGHVNFLTLDVFTIWIPQNFMPMALVSWVILNVISAVLPFSLSNGFYRWTYALPAHAAYEILTDIRSSGCNPHLYFALPILFAYEVLGTVGTALGAFRRCHMAAVEEEENEKILTELASRLPLPNRSADTTCASADANDGSRRKSEDMERNQHSDALSNENLDELEQSGQSTRQRRFVDELDRIESSNSRLDSSLGPSFRM